MASPRKKLALISVFDKAGVVDFARALHETGHTILSTGGTARILRESEIPVVEVSDYTGFPEMLDGRVKTLHPRIHGGLLARRDLTGHMETIQKAGIELIQILAINLYPFEETLRKPGASREEIIEMIDIGGPAMIRSAAKNHRDVTVVVNPSDYPRVASALRATGETSPELRSELAAKAFARTASYDATIQGFFSAVTGEPDGVFPPSLDLRFEKVGELRYGENPHQQAAFYREPSAPPGSLARATQIHGKELSFNNLLDLDSAWGLVGEFSEPAAIIIKHNNPCGAAVAGTTVEAFTRARETDPVSAFGGVVGLNRPLDVATAKEIGEMFLEAIIAPEFEEEALTLLKKKAKLRLLRADAPSVVHPGLDLKRVSGGLLAQSWDSTTTSPSEGKVVTRRTPSSREMEDLGFAWKVAKHVRSNAIVYVSDKHTVGVGAGQMSRVDAAKIGAQKARSSLQGSVLASDAFFPFRDGIDAAAEVGVKAVVQPGGSIRDEEVVAAADEHEMAMVFTGERHFRH